MKTIIHCGHHKCGSVLFGNVLRKICKHLHLSFCGTPGPEKEGLYTLFDVLIFSNSTIMFENITRPYVGTHMIRDPRDVIISGYLYHKHCEEKWCTNRPDENIASIGFPQIPHSQHARTAKWKAEYLRSLGGSSYQETINSLDQEDGIIFEMCNYGRWTTEAMRDWDYSNSRIKELKFEDIMGDFMGSFEQVFLHYGFPVSVTQGMLELVVEENITNLSDIDISESSHIHSRQTTKWKEYFSSRHKNLFKEMFGNVLIDLGYEKDNNW